MADTFASPGPELKRLRDVIGQHLVVARKVRDRSGNASDAIVAAKGKTEPVCRTVQQAEGRAVQAAVAFEQSRRQFGVGPNLMMLISGLLPIPRRDNPASYRRGRLANARF